MNQLRSALEAADPLRHEPPLSPDLRQELRSRVLQAVDGQARHHTRSSSLRWRMIAAVAALVLCLAYVIGPTQLPLSAAMRFEVRLAETRPAPGLTVAEVQGTQQLIYLHPEAVVGNEDLVQAFVVPQGSDFGVRVELSPLAEQRLRKATAAHIGRPAAILLDGEVVIAPTVRASIGASPVITGAFSEADAERIATAIMR